MGVLRSRTGGREVVLSAEHVVGRMSSCALPRSSAFVSASHAMVRWDGQGWSIRDLGSRNGTYVNDAALARGQSVLLRRGARIAFGGPGETWELTDAGGPSAAIIPLDGGDPIFLTQPITGIPTLDEPLATVYLDAEDWLLECDESRVGLRPGAEFVVAGHRFRFECPSGASATVASADHDGDLSRATLILCVSRDEEHVSLQLQTEDRTQDLGERASFYLMLVLARERLASAGLDPAESGWIAIDSLLKMIPDYSSGVHLNVEIFRLRRLLGNAGVRDAARVIERRRGEIRLGSDRIEIRSELARVASA